MRSAVERDVRALLGAAEGQGRCAMATERWMTRALTTRVGAGTVVMPRPGMYARRSWWRDLSVDQRDRAALRAYAHAHPETVFCGHSAAVLHGLAVGVQERTAIHVVSSYARETPGVVRHDIEAGELAACDGLVMTGLTRTVLDCAGSLPFGRALATMGSALRGSGWAREEMGRRIADRWRGRRGVRRCLAVLAQADGRAASGGESLARAMMIRLGFQLPDLQVALDDPEAEACDGDAGRDACEPPVAFGWFCAGRLVAMGFYDDAGSYGDAGSALDAPWPTRTGLCRAARLARYRVPVALIGRKHLQSPLAFRRLLESCLVPHVASA